MSEAGGVEFYIVMDHNDDLVIFTRERYLDHVTMCRSCLLIIRDTLRPHPLFVMERIEQASNMLCKIGLILRDDFREALIATRTIQSKY